MLVIFLYYKKIEIEMLVLRRNWNWIIFLRIESKFGQKLQYLNEQHNNNIIKQNNLQEIII